MSAGNLGVCGSADTLGGFGSFVSRQVRKTVNVAQDIASPVVSLAKGNVLTAAQQFGKGIIAPTVITVKLAQQVAEGKVPDIESARDVGLRQVGNLANEGMDAIKRAIKSAITPVVRSFLNGANELGADDASAKSTIKNQATIAALPVGASAGAAAGSLFPGIGTAVGAATATAIVPGLVSEIVDGLWSEGKRAVKSASQLANEKASQSAADAVRAAASGASAAGAARGKYEAEQAAKRKKAMFIGGIALVGLVFLAKGKKS